MPIDRYELRRVLLARREELSQEVALDPTETIELDQARVGRLSRAEAMQDHQMALEQQQVFINLKGLLQMEQTSMWQVIELTGFVR